MRVAIAVLIGLCCTAPLAAHEPHAAALATFEQEARASGVQSPSGWDLAAMGVLAAGGVLYAIGSRRLLRRGARVRSLERGAFWAGWGVLIMAIAPPLDRMAALLFSAHMAQHELLMLIGAPLVVLGRPIVPWMWALPSRLKPSAGAGLQWAPISRAWRVGTTPVVAWALHGIAIWVWHLPALYEAAVRSEALHAFQHATFVGTAVLFWWGLVYGRYGRAAYGASVLYVFTTMVAHPSRGSPGACTSRATSKTRPRTCGGGSSTRMRTTRRR